MLNKILQPLLIGSQMIFRVNSSHTAKLSLKKEEEEAKPLDLNAINNNSMTK